MSYTEFLFNKILCIYSPFFNQMDYDCQFDRTTAECNDFLRSEYNVSDIGQYEAIENYIKDCLLKPRLYTMEFIRKNVVRNEDVFFLTGLDYGQVKLDDVAPKNTFEINGDYQLEFNLNN